MTIGAVLTDIEGTTTDIEFVHATLFPLSRRLLPDYVIANWEAPEVVSARAAVAAARGALAIPRDEVIAALLSWIDDDRKETSLKVIQGKIWRAAYESGAVRSHVYPDVEPALRRWTERGLEVHVFSSGSVEAQKLLFAHSAAGDLTPYLTAYFDTTTGPKRELTSYQRIAEAVRRAPPEILFLSDVTAELDAAREAGMQTTQLLRPSTPEDPASRHRVAAKFDDVLV